MFLFFAALALKLNLLQVSELLEHFMLCALFPIDVAENCDNNRGRQIDCIIEGKTMD